MKKLILALICITSIGTMRAEDVVQVVPFETKAGATVDDALCFSVAMNNASAEIWALQFDLLLPEGMTIDDVSGYDPFELNKERFPHTTGRGEAITWKHSVYYDLLESGWYRIIVFTSETERIIGDSGELFNVYYLTDETMQPGMHPIYIKGTVLTITGSTDIKLGESTSYCLIGDSPLKNAEEVDLNDFTGYIPSWVVESLNADLASNTATAVRMGQTDGIGAVIETANKNALYYVKAGSECAEQLIGKNVVEVDGEAYRCSDLYLYDGEYNFSNPQTIAGNKAYFDRTFIEEYWSTVCLPFAVTSEQVGLLKENGVQIEMMSGFDGSTITFATVDEMLANTPYIMKCSSEMAPFAELEIAKIFSTMEQNEVSVGNIQMKGCYATTILNSDENTTFYVFKAATGEFVKVGRNGKVMPFRAYIQLTEDGTLPATMRVRHENEETDITLIQENDATKTNVYTVSGKLVREGISGQQTILGLEKGVYIINNRKVIIR